MSIDFRNFFENPSILSAVIVVLFIAGNVFIAYLNNKNNRKTRDDNKERGDSIVEAITKQSNLLQVLVDKEINRLNKQSTEEIISATMHEAENTVKDEIMRIFQQNHRLEKRRQVLIQKGLKSLIDTIYDGSINTLKSLAYKEKNLAEHLTDFDKEKFMDGLLEHVFNKSENDSQDLADTLYYIRTYFTTIITNAKSYYSNL